jgi:CO dehydrogenase/acetyl-CoA synthase epsilon subunit
MEKDMEQREKPKKPILVVGKVTTEDEVDDLVDQMMDKLFPELKPTKEKDKSSSK